MSARFVFAGVLLAAVAAPATTFAQLSAELYKTEPESFGRFEARVRYAAGDGVVSSFFLWKEGSEVAGAYWNELDFEKLNADCRMQTNTLYGNPLQHAEQVHRMPADMCDAYHDYGYEWTPEYIAWFIDGQEIRRETGAAATAFAQNAAGGMRVHFNVWPGTEDFGGNFNPGILPVRQYISWVQYSAYENGSFRLEWREDFNGPGIPQGWTTGNWESPLQRSTHDPRNVTIVNGIAVLSLTSDASPGFDGVPPSDGSGGSGGTPASGGAGAGGAATGGGPNAAGGTPSSGGSAASGGAAGATSVGGTDAGGGPNGGAGNTTTGGTANAGGNAIATGGTTNVATGGATGGTGGATSVATGGTSAAGMTSAGGTSSPGSGGTSSPGSGGTGIAGQVNSSGNSGGSTPESGGCAWNGSPPNGGRLALFGAAAWFALAACRRRRTKSR